MIKNWLIGLSLGSMVQFAVGANAAVSAPTALSINLCSDQMLLLLADPEQIKALSILSHDEAGSYLVNEARQYPKADALAEEILPYSPDIVLTGPYTSSNTLALLKELGLRVESLEIANSIEAMMRNITRVGAVLAQEQRAADIVDSLRLRILTIKSKSTAIDQQFAERKMPRPRAAVYDANGYTSGVSSMRGEAMELSGWHNVATDKGIDSYGVISLEELILLAPDVLIESPYSPDTYSRGQNLTSHPALRKSGLNPLLVTLPSNASICAGPWSVDNVEMLLEARASLLH